MAIPPNTSYGYLDRHYLQTDIIPASVIVLLYNSGRFNRGKSYVDGIPLPNAISNTTQFNHANIALPKMGHYHELLIVSPDMHKVHHHYKLPIPTVITEIYFQFGTVFRDIQNTSQRRNCIWNWHTWEEHNELKNLLKIPFQNNVPRKDTPHKKKSFLWLE
jgi:hypothetical protein